MKRTVLHEIGPLLAGGLEACWMAGMLRLLETRFTPGALSVAWLILGLPAAFVLGRLSQAFSRPLRAALGLAAGLAWVLLLIAFSVLPLQALTKPGWFTELIAGLFQGKGGPSAIQISALAAAAAWVAGLRLAGIAIGFEQLIREFQFGLMILLGVFFCAAQLEMALPSMPAVVVVFFLLFLVGAAAVRSSEVGGWLLGAARTHWAAALFFNAGLVLSVGLLLTAVVTPGVLALILGILESAWDALIEWVIRFVAFLAQLIPQPEIKAYGIGAGAGPAPQNPASMPDLLSIPDYVRRVAGWLVSAFWIVLFAVCLWRIAAQVAGWLRRQMNGMDGAQIEPLTGSFRQDLLRLLQYVHRRIAGWMAWLRYAVGRRSPAETTPAEAAAVRRLYRALLAWSAAGGCARRRHQTPHEFLEQLCARLPQARPQLTLITEQYAAVRYGGRLPSADAVESLERLWQDVRRMRRRSLALPPPDAL
jgi:hypothetical protein